jgi:hypothetical protein
MTIKTIIFIGLTCIILAGCGPSAPKKTGPDQNKLAGDWIRTDGGYMLKILGATPDGKLDAGYFNPNPIHVARAEWQNRDGQLIVLVELQDANYPGSTYTLAYLPDKDCLIGNYYQAVEKVNFDVQFVRRK